MLDIKFTKTFQEFLPIAPYSNPIRKLKAYQHHNFIDEENGDAEKVTVWLFLGSQWGALRA